MNLKAAIMLCLLFFATTMVTSIAASFVSLPNIVNVTDFESLYAGFSIEPLGDPVDIADPPH